MSKNWRKWCDDMIIWAWKPFATICGGNPDRGSTRRYTGEELEGEWFPQSRSGRLLDLDEEGRVGTGGDIGGITENRCSDPKIIEGDTPNSETNAVYFEDVSVESRPQIEWHDDIDV